MPENLTSPTPGPVETATPPAAPVADTGTVQPSGDASGGQSASAEEMFGNVDPRTLPPQLKSVYDNMLRGFKEKTTKLSETVKSETAKAVEQFKQKAELYEQFATQEEFVKQWNDYVQKVNANVNANPDDPAAKLEKKVQMLEAEVVKGAVNKAIDEFADAVDDKGKPLHGNFDKLNDIIVSELEGEGGKKQQISLLKAAIDLSPGRTYQEKIESGYAIADKLYTQIFEEGRKAGMGRTQAKILNGTQPPSGISPTSEAGRRPKNALEALQFAKQGLAVHKDK